MSSFKTLSRSKVPYCDNILLISFFAKGSSAEKIKDSTRFFRSFLFIFFPLSLFFRNDFLDLKVIYHLKPHLMKQVVSIQ